MSTSSGRKRSLRVSSPLRRPFASSLYARSLRCEQLEDRRLLAQLTVTTDQDIVDFNDGVTSLREAVFAANIVPGADEIVFEFGHDGPATILLSQGELRIEDSLTITGPCAGLLTIDARQQSRIFNITATTGDFVFSGMTLTRGSTSLNGSAFGGGAIRSLSTGLMSLVDMRFEENRTLGNDVSGGAIYAVGSITTANSTFTANQTFGSNSNGGAVFTLGTLTADGTGFIINRTTGNGSAGGAISATSLVMTNSTVSGNSTLGVSAFGGGINVGQFRGSGLPSSIVDSFIIDNYTVGTNSQGGGIFSSRTITIERSTVSGNMTFGNNAGGGGLYATVGILRDSVLGANRTYGAGSSGGGAASGVTFRPTWQISGTTFMVNETFGTGSRGGALAVEGELSISGSTFLSNTAMAGGGALFLTQTGARTAAISSSSFTDNSSSSGGAIFSQGNLTITDSVLTGNRAKAAEGSRAGGGAIAQSSTAFNGLTILRSRITDNHATGQNLVKGGGIRADGRVTITESEISGNRVVGPGAQGGGLFAGGGTTITDSTISDNQIIGSGSAGGGIALGNGNLDAITSSTISGNQVTGDQTRGGGLYSNGRIDIRHTTVTSNRVNSSTGETGGLWVNALFGGLTGPRVRISHSIVAGNFVGTTASDLRTQPLLSYSLVGTRAGTEFVEAPVGSPDANGNLIGGPIHGVIDPLLGPLADNGGPTKTHALLVGSPAINAGEPTSVGGANSVPLFDQRGAPFARVAGGRIDIGAFESQPASGSYNSNFDGDGDVDGRDFLAWQRGYGRSAATTSDGDAMGDGDVDGLDLVVWQEMYGTTIADFGVRSAESTETAPVRATGSLLFLPHESVQGHTNDIPLAEYSALRIPQSELAIDRAFDHWLPPSRSIMNFGDIATHRAAKRRVLV